MCTSTSLVTRRIYPATKSAAGEGTFGFQVVEMRLLSSGVLYDGIGAMIIATAGRSCSGTHFVFLLCFALLNPPYG
jgi:hypothetical protein